MSRNRITLSLLLLLCLFILAISLSFAQPPNCVLICVSQGTWFLATTTVGTPTLAATQVSQTPGISTPSPSPSPSKTLNPVFQTATPGSASATVDLTRVIPSNFPTIDPSPTPEVFTPGQQVRVIVSLLNVRSVPGKSNPMLRVLTYGTEVRLVNDGIIQDGCLWRPLSSSEWIAVQCDGVFYVEFQ